MNSYNIIEQDFFDSCYLFAKMHEKETKEAWDERLKNVTVGFLSVNED